MPTPTRKPSSSNIAVFAGGFPALFDQYGQALADHVAQAFPPQYRLAPPTLFLDRIRGLGRAPFPAQIQAAAALATRLETHRAAIVVGEASVGKTQIALTTAAMLGATSVLVVAATNLLSQWQDEIRAVLPKARIYTDLTSITLVNRTMAEIQATKQMSIVLLSRDQAKLGSPWRPSAVEVPGVVPASPTEKVSVPYCLGCKRILLHVLTATYFANDGTERRAKTLIAIPMHRLAKGAIAYCPDCHKLAAMVPVNGPAPQTWATCPRCRHALATVHTVKKADPVSHQTITIPDWIEPWTADDLTRSRHRCPTCGEACWQSTRTLHGRAAFSIAKYLGRRYPGAYDLLLTEECFPANTPVTTPAGLVPIQDLRPGNQVLSYKDGRIVTRRVVRTIKKQLDSYLVRVTHEHGTIHCTPNHRIYTTRGYVPAADLRPSDTLIALEGHPYADRDKNMPGVRGRIPVSEIRWARQANLWPIVRRQITMAHAHAPRQGDIDHHKDVPGVRDDLRVSETSQTRTTDVQPIVRETAVEANSLTPTTRTPQTTFQSLRTLRHHLPNTETARTLLWETLLSPGPLESPRISPTRRHTSQAAAHPEAAPMDDAPCSTDQSRSRSTSESHCGTPRPTIPSSTVPQGTTDETTGTPPSGNWVAARVYDSDRRLMVEIRDGRFGQPRPQNRYRVRRTVSSYSVEALSRQTENQSTTVDRVESPQILEQGDSVGHQSGSHADRGYRQSSVVSVVQTRDTDCEYVYDLEVEDTHCYFADNALVSNCHDYKASETANGMMLTDLIRASKRVLGQTATLSGGKPSTMFYLLHRLLPAFRRTWPYSATTRFSREHGLAEVLSEEQRRQVKDRSGRLTTATTFKRTIRELPGISPTILRYVLDSAVFLTLHDLGVQMPPYTEEAIEIPMLPDQMREYEALVAALAPHLKAGLRLRQLKALGTAIQALLTYPDQPWRGEAVTHHKTGELVASAPALDPTIQYPKEAELLRLCRQEAQDGRRVLVYVTHTDRRDILPRLEELLRTGGLRTQVLRAETVSPRKRAQWVRSQALNVDVLISHPKLVGTGLNIPEFHTVVWYEPEWSAYTLRQASRRTWRIGQEKPVKVYFLVYAGTAQQPALALVSRKILASLLVEGQVETEHAIATYDSSGDVFYELAKAVLDRTQTTDIHETLRTLSQAQTRAQELCDAALVPALPAPEPELVKAPTLEPDVAPPAIAAPASVAAATPGPSIVPPVLATRRRSIAITKPVLAEQTSLFS